MFSTMPEGMQARMKYLEAIDAADRNDGTGRMQRLRQIPPDTGKLLAILAATCPPGDIIEIGTSAGYSTMWLWLAAKACQRRLKTYELLPEKIRLAKETFRICEISDYIDLIEGDALEHLDRIATCSFAFIDCEKELYGQVWDKLKTKVVSGGIIVADNAINHYDTLQPMIERALADDTFDSVIIPNKNGELVCRKK